MSSKYPDLGTAHAYAPRRQYNASITAGAEGFALGSVATLFGGTFLQRRSPTIRNLPVAIKFSMVLSGGLAIAMIYADKAGIAVDVR